MHVNARSMAVNIIITSSLNSFASERRFNIVDSIAQLKSKLELITGASWRTMILELFNDEGKFIKSLNDDSATLSSCDIKDEMRIHVIESNPLKKKGEFEDVSQVEKYEMSEEDYGKRANSARAFLEQQRKLQSHQQDDQDKEQQLAAESIKVGCRCEVTLPNSPPRKGLVMFVGETKFKSGYWVGVRYDEPYGKNDGSVAGYRYFDCPPKYGGFVKPSLVKVGDYPEDNLLDDDEM